MLAATAAVVVWGVSSVAIKQVEGLNGLGVACYRIWLGRRHRHRGVPGHRRAHCRSGSSACRWPAGSRSRPTSCCSSCAVQETSIANATVIGALQPVLVARGGQPAVRRAGAAQPRSLWGAVAVAGTAIVVLGGDGGGANSLYGDLLAVGRARRRGRPTSCSPSPLASTLTAFEYLTGMAIVAAVVVRARSR